MSFRDSILAISPAWLTDAVGGGVQYAEGLVLDMLDTWSREGMKARFPGESTNDSLGLLGNDRLLERGPTEIVASYVARLRAAFDTWRGAGNPYTLAPLLGVFFSGLGSVPYIRLVSNTSVWHNYLGGNVGKVIGANNWIWDIYTGRWWRGWAIIDQSGFSSIAPVWTRDMWGAATGTWGDGGTWGSDMTVDQSAFLLRTLRRWKPANVAAMLIVNFGTNMFQSAYTADGISNPNGGMNDPDTRLTFNAIYSSEIAA